MDINKIEDVIFPQKKILFDTDWDTEILPIIQGYADFWGKELTPTTSTKEIEECETRLGTKLPEDLKTFYFRFGNAKLGEELLPVAEMDYLPETWDKSFFENYSETERQEIFKVIIFADYLGSGNYWCFHKDTKHIFYYNHDTQPNVNEMFNNFGEYLKWMLIFTQGEMGQHIDGLEEELEKIVIEKIGIDKIRTWRYYEG